MEKSIRKQILEHCRHNGWQTCRGIDEKNQKVLWADHDNNVYCVSSYKVVDGIVEFEPMPGESFEKVF